MDSVFRAGKNYYPQVFQKNVNMLLKKKKILNYIIHDIEISSDSDRESYDEEDSDKESSDEQNPFGQNK